MLSYEVPGQSFPIDTKIIKQISTSLNPNTIARRKYLKQRKAWNILGNLMSSAHCYPSRWGVPIYRSTDCINEPPLRHFLPLSKANLVLTVNASAGSATELTFQTHSCAQGLLVS